MSILEQKYVVINTNALVTEGNISLMHLVELFEMGAENVYLVDEQGRYRWRTAQRSRTKIIINENSGVQIIMSPLEPIVYSGDVTKDNQILQDGERIFLRNPDIKEFPVVDGGGRIVRVVRTREQPKGELNWDCFSDDVVLCQFQGKKVFVSSRKNKRISAFLDKFENAVHVSELSEANIPTAFSDEGLILFDCDIFPDVNKISIWELYERCKREIPIRNYSTKCLIDKDWVSLELGEDLTLVNLLKYFDDYYQAVHFEEDTGRYLGSLSLPKFGEAFRGDRKIPSLENLSLNYVDDEASLKKAWAEKLLGSQIHETVFLKDSKIIANGVYLMGGISGLSERNMMYRQRPYWKLISNDVAREFFGSRRRILLSSEGGAMTGFKERFENFLDIEIFDGSQMESYINGQYDLLIYEASIWPDGKTRACKCRSLYVDLLAESLRRYWQDRGIVYYACDVENHPRDISSRLVTERTMPEKPSSNSAWQGLREDYVFHADYNGDEFINVIGSHRIDAPRLKDYTKTVWVAGPCIAFGEAAPYGETIEAKLQEKLNSSGLTWRVVNCGSFGTNSVIFSDFNMLNYLIDLPVHRGDIVIHFTQFLWKSSEHFPLKNFFYTHEVFDDEEHIKGKYWHDMCTAHMNKYGYEVWADFLFNKLKDKFKEKETNLNPYEQSKLVKPYSNLLPINYQVKNNHLKKYLQTLICHRHDERGAIVMNANPFTLGHLYLVDEARKKVDFLYVFVVEEDKSEISFKDRLVMVQKNCENMANVEVLPSGQYMISSLTFADYFQKEEMQEEKILPTKDVKLFAEAVAPVLGITKRFVGEEPFDKVTRQYNEVMKDILPGYGIELVEIPRKTSSEGIPINATQVRKWLHDGKFKECEQFLPLASLDYLKDVYSEKGGAD